jgi:hypothetical protein
MKKKIVKKKRQKDTLSTMAKRAEIDNINNPNIVNKEAFLKYQETREHPMLNEKKNFVASDGSIINLLNLPHNIKINVEHLPPAEQKKIKALSKVAHHIMCTANGYKTRAFGIGHFRQVKDDEPSVLLQNYKEELIELFGRMFTCEEVHQIVVSDWKFPCAIGAVYGFRKAYINDITTKISNFRLAFDDIRLSVKRSRLEELTWTYVTMKEKYKKTTGVMEHRALIQNLEQLRKEVDGDSIRVEGNMDINIESAANLHIQKEVFKELNLNQIIIARIASRQMLHPAQIIKSLADNYYSKYSALLHDVEDTEYEDVEFPSNNNYDFEEIASRNQLWSSEQKKSTAEIKEIQAIQQHEAESRSLKEKLFERLDGLVNKNKKKESAVMEQVATKENRDLHNPETYKVKPKKKLKSVTKIVKKHGRE